MRSQLAAGQAAPAFSLPRDGGGRIALTDFAGRALVLYFYPRADTPGCSREAQAFSQLQEAFGDASTSVLGVSADSIPTQDRFKQKYALAIPLASDETHEMLNEYGVWGEKSMYGRTFMGIERATFLIGPDARIVRIWRKVKVEGHADVVLEAARSLPQERLKLV